MKRVAAGVVIGIMLMQAAASASQDAHAGSEPVREICVAVAADASLSDQDVAELVAAGEATVVGLGDACSTARVSPPLDEPPDAARHIEEATGGLVDIHETAWEQLVVRPDGRTVDIYFWGGHKDCTDLDRVEVKAAPRGWDIRVFTGRRPDVEVCPAVASRYVVTIELDAPLFTGGSDRRRGG